MPSLQTTLSTLTLLTLGLLHATQARADPPPRPGIPMQAIGEIRVQASGRCLDLRTTSSGSNVIVWDCHGGASQRWYFTVKGLIRSFLNPDVCLDVYRASSNNGTNVQVYDCHGGNAQQWRLTENNQLQSRVGPNRCLDAMQGGPNNGSNVMIWSCYSTNNQRWTFNQQAAIPALQAAGKLRSAAGNNLCLDVSAAGVADGTNVQSWTCTDVGQQDWYMTMYGEIRVGHAPGMCLDVRGANNANGTNVQLYRCNGTKAQQWELTDDGLLRSALPGDRCLDVGRTPGVGTNVHIWSCHGLAHQQWQIARQPWALIHSERDRNECLVDSGGTARNRDDVIAGPCAQRPEQLWMMTPAGEIRNAEAHNRCLDIVGGNLTAGTNVHSWTCNGTDAQKWKLTPEGELRSVGNPNLCLDRTSSGSVKVHTCHGGSNQKWSSRSLLQVQVTQVGDYYGILFKRGDEGQMITHPVEVLRTLSAMGYDGDELRTVYNGFTATQRAGLPAFHAADYSASFSTSYSERVTLRGNAEFVASPTEVRARAGLTAVELQSGAWTAQVNGPAVEYVHVSDRGIGFSAGANLIGATGSVGDSDGSQASVGVSAGIGIEGAISLGAGDRYGVTFGIKAVTINVYVTGEDFRDAVTWTSGAVDSAGGWMQGAAEDSASWVSGAGVDAAEWLGDAVETSAAWTEQALEDAGDWVEGAGESIADALCSIFCW